MHRQTLLALLLCAMLSAPAFAATARETAPARDITTAPEPTNFGVLLDSGDTEPAPEESAPAAQELERLLLREDDVEGVFLVIKTDEEFRIVELAHRTREPYVVGTSDGGVWKVGQLAQEDTKYGPVLKVKPQGLTELQELDTLFTTTWKGGVRVAVGDVTGDGKEGIEPDEIDSRATGEEAGMPEAERGVRTQGADGTQPSAGIEPDEIDNALAGDELAMLLPAVQKIRAADAAASDEELAALLLPAVQKVQAAAEPEKGEGFFGKLFSFFG